jgi:tetratricopeptide (TPR) repeat protein
LLFLLAERRGQLVARDEIVERVWEKGVHLDSDASINAAVRKIRRVLGDDADAPRFIITVPAKGYRFIANVCEESLATSEEPAAQPEQPRTPSAAPPRGLAWGHFIGRAQEMAALRAAIDASLGGQASLVMLVGEPGIGKTRLVEEAAIYARQRGAQVLVGHCYEGEAASPYSSFVEAIREYASRRSEDVLKAEMGDGASDLAELVPEIRKRIPDLPPSPPADPNGERTRLFESVASFILNASKANPIMLLLEDLHWADQASLQLLQHLARRFKGNRLIAVGTYRDVDVDRNHPLSTMLAELRRERLYERVLLRGLSESEVKDLIEAISQQEVATGASEAFVRAILRETEGNPFFIEEVLRHLVESGGLHRCDDRWVIDAKSIGEMGVPEGVRDVIGRRLSRLSKPTNRVLAAAAVFGSEFELAVIGRMSKLGENAIWPAVEEGLSNRLVVEMRGHGNPLYAFTHALVRQTLVEELSQPRRQHLHLMAAQAIEAAHGRNVEPHIPALAKHYRSAGAAADPEKVIDYSIRAGSAAYAVFAYEEAGAHWQGALELMDEQGGGDRKRRAGLLWQLGDELVSSGAKAIEYLEAAALLFEELGDDEAACDVHTRLTIYLGTNNVGTMDRRRAMPHLRKAEGLLARQPESLRHAMFYLTLAGAYNWAHRLSDANAAWKRAMGICERQDLDGPWCVAAVNSGLSLIYSGSVTEGLRLIDQARRRADRTNDQLAGFVVAWVGGYIYRQLASHREARDWHTNELAKPYMAQAAYHRAFLQHRLAASYAEMGELAKARALVAEANPDDKPGDFLAGLLLFEGEWDLAGKRLAAEFERLHRSGNLLDEVLARLDLARVHRFAGERAQALQVLQRALEISVEGGNILYELMTRLALATIAANAGNTGEALPHLERCRQIVGPGENWFGVAGMVQRAEAVVAAAQGEYAVAETHFEKAIAIFERYSLLWEEADTLQYWGRALLAAGKHVRAMETFDAAIEIYRSRGAGVRFVEYVMADRKRAQDSKSAV